MREHVVPSLRIVSCPGCRRRNRLAAGHAGARCGACGTALARTRLPISWGIAALTGLYATGLLAAWWLTTRVGEGWWLSTALLYLPRAGYALPLLLLAPLAAWKARRWLPVQVGCLLFVLGPLMGWHAPGRGEALPAVAGGRSAAEPIRLLTYNIGQGDLGAAALRAAAARWDAHIVVAQESRNLKTLFPGWETHHEGEYFLATRLPLLEAGTRAFLPDRAYRRGARYRLQGPDGSFTLYSLHLDTPRRALEELKGPLHTGGIRWRNLGRAVQALSADAERRALEARAARAWVEETSSASCIVAGDFNMPPDSPLSRRLWSGFRDAFAVAGSGYGYTAHAPYPWVRIDRVLVTPEWRVRRAATGPGTGRDHRPLLVELWR